MTQTATAFVTKMKFPAAHLKQRATTIQLQQTTMDHVPKKTLRVSAVARARRMPMRMVFATILMIASARLMSVVFATAMASLTVPATATATFLMSVAFVAVMASLTVPATATATFLTSVAFVAVMASLTVPATATATFLTSVAFAAVMASLTVPAIATATFLTSVAFVAVMEALALIHARLQVSRALTLLLSREMLLRQYRGLPSTGSTLMPMMQRTKCPLSSATTRPI